VPVKAEELVQEEEADRVSTLGHAIYDQRLKGLLEPQYNGQDLAIHVDSGDYEVGRWGARPGITLRKRHPEVGMILLTKVGPPQPDDALAARMLMNKLSSARNK